MTPLEQARAEGYAAGQKAMKERVGRMLVAVGRNAHITSLLERTPITDEKGNVI